MIAAEAARYKIERTEDRARRAQRRGSRFWACAWLEARERAVDDLVWSKEDKIDPEAARLEEYEADQERRGDAMRDGDWR